MPLNVEEHVKFVGYILELYNNSWEKVCSLVGVTCDTNKSIANSTDVPLVGCAIHRFNLAVQDLLSE